MRASIHQPSTIIVLFFLYTPGERTAHTRHPYGTVRREQPTMHVISRGTPDALIRSSVSSGGAEARATRHTRGKILISYRGSASQGSGDDEMTRNVDEQSHQSSHHTR